MPTGKNSGATTATHSRKKCFEVNVYYYKRATSCGDETTNTSHYRYDESTEHVSHHAIKCSDGDDALQVLADFCMRQTARRDVLVLRFEVFEFVRREINVYAATDARGGIIIKNKRYRGLFGAAQDTEIIAVDGGDESAQPAAVATTAAQPVAEAAAVAPVPAAATAAPRVAKNGFDPESLLGTVAPSNQKLPLPILNGYVTCDNSFMSRSVFFTPTYAALESKYTMKTGKVYPVYTRVRSENAMPGMAVPRVLLRNDAGELVLVEEVHLTEPPSTDGLTANDYAIPGSPPLISQNGGGAGAGSAPVLRPNSSADAGADMPVLRPNR